MGKIGRPITYQTHEERLAAGAMAAKEYRARKKAEKMARKNHSISLKSSIIDLTTTLASLNR